MFFLVFFYEFIRSFFIQCKVTCGYKIHWGGSDVLCIVSFYEKEYNFS